MTMYTIGAFFYKVVQYPVIITILLTPFILLFTMARKSKMIAISEENYELLKKKGSTGESFNDVLTFILQTEPKNVVRERSAQNKAEPRKNCEQALTMRDHEG